MDIPPVFFDIMRDLPRQGPGSAEATARALALAGELPAEPLILDMGCGPGAQSLELARLTRGRVFCLDIFPQFLAELRAHAAAAGLASRIQPVRADMAAPPFANASFDLLWSEGAVYIPGFEAGLSAWRRLARLGARVAVSELSWLGEARPAEAVNWWAEAYPAMADVATNLDRMRRAGWEPLGSFALPSAAWRENYYGPMRERLPRMRHRHADDPTALAIIDEAEAEMELFERHEQAYGYVFYVGRVA